MEMSIEQVARRALRFEALDNFGSLSAEFREITLALLALNPPQVEQHPIIRFMVLHMKTVCCREAAQLDIYTSRRAVVHISKVDHADEEMV